MSRKSRTEPATLPASSFSSLEPGATFCFKRPLILSFADFTAAVPTPGLSAKAGRLDRAIRMTTRRFMVRSYLGRVGAALNSPEPRPCRFFTGCCRIDLGVCGIRFGERGLGIELRADRRELGLRVRLVRVGL